MPTSENLINILGFDPETGLKTCSSPKDRDLEAEFADFNPFKNYGDYEIDDFLVNGRRDSKHLLLVGDIKTQIFPLSPDAIMPQPKMGLH